MNDTSTDEFLAAIPEVPLKVLPVSPRKSSDNTSSRVERQLD